VGSDVALKIYLPSLLQGIESLRIQREFNIAAEIQHANLARVYDLLLSPSRPFHSFMVMEFIEGPTLKDFIVKQGKLSVSDTVSVGRQLFAALAELHSLGALHRDVKAANIMVASAAPGAIAIKLVDLGIVSVAADEKLTVPSVFLGSKHSAPLEQLTGGELDQRTDIYGAGSVLFHCFTGRPMYSGVGPEGAIVRRMLQDPEQLVAAVSSGGRPNIESFINKCLNVEQRERPATARECSILLDEIARARPLSVESVAGSAGRLQTVGL
jgi:serine/threonine protein kinase